MNCWKRWKRPTCQNLCPKNSAWRLSYLKLVCLTFYIIWQQYRGAHYVVHVFSWFRTWPCSSRSQGLPLALDKRLQEDRRRVRQDLSTLGYTMSRCTLRYPEHFKTSWFGSSVSDSKSGPVTWSVSPLIEYKWRGKAASKITKNQRSPFQGENASIHFFSALALASFQLDSFRGSSR